MANEIQTWRVASSKAFEREQRAWRTACDLRDGLDHAEDLENAALVRSCKRGIRAAELRMAAAHAERLRFDALLALAGVRS